MAIERTSPDLITEKGVLPPSGTDTPAMAALLALLLLGRAAAQDAVSVILDINGAKQPMVIPTADAIDATVAAFAARHQLDGGMGCADRGCVEHKLRRRAREAVADALLPKARCRNEPCGPIATVLDAHGSNKCVNGLGSLYDLLLPDAVRRKATAVLEVGVGTLDDAHPSSMAREVQEGRLRTDEGVDLYAARERRPTPEGVRCVDAYCVGASLRAWAELFPHATVIGLDPAEDAAALNGLHKRIHVLTCDSRDASAVAALEGLKVTSFDLIVDDGHHSLDAQKRTLATLWRFVKPGGLYVVEDVADWGESLVSDRGTLANVVGRETPYFFLETMRSQTATSSWPGVPQMGALVFRK